jgi:3-phytase
VGEFVYEVEAVSEQPVPADGFATNGLVDLLAIDNNGTLLALERSFSVGVGNTVKLYEIRTQGALDVSSLDSLAENGEAFEIDPAVSKREIFDFSSLGIPLDNLEGIELGPQLADGRQSLIVVSDNNFSSTQSSQFIALALDLDNIPVVLPELETPQFVDSDQEIPDGATAGDADDPAIWVNPIDASKSLVVTALKDGGLAVLDLKGQIVQNILPADYGDIRYNNVDILYSFKLGGETVDLAIASDRKNDTLAIYKIDPTTRLLSDANSVSIPATIFGIDDGEQTAYGLATYISPVSGKHYVFVSQRAGNQIAQLELVDDGAGGVTASVVRTLTVPIPLGCRPRNRLPLRWPRKFWHLEVLCGSQWQYNWHPDRLRGEWQPGS